MENLHRSTQCRHFRIYVHTNLLLAQTLLAFNITYVCHTNWGKSAQDRNASFDSFPPCSAFLCPAHPLQGDFTVIIQHGPARTGSARASHGPPPAANRPVTGPPQAGPTHAHPARTRIRPVRPARTAHRHAPTARTGFAGSIRLHVRLCQTHPAGVTLKAPHRPGPARA